MKKLPIILCTILGIIVLSYQPPERSMAATPHVIVKQINVLDEKSILLIKRYDEMSSNTVEINKLFKEKTNENIIVTSNNPNN